MTRAFSVAIIISAIAVSWIIIGLMSIPIPKSDSDYEYTGIIKTVNYEESHWASQFSGWRYRIEPDNPDRFISSYYLGAIPYRDRKVWFTDHSVQRFHVGDAVRFNAELGDGMGFGIWPYEATEVKLID